MTKYSVSLPDDLTQAIKNRYPDTPFSTAIAKLVRKGLDSTCGVAPGECHPTNAIIATCPTIPTPPSEISGSTNITYATYPPESVPLSSQFPTAPQPDFAEIIRAIIREELSQTSVSPQPIVVDNPIIVTKKSGKNDPEWLTNTQIISLLPENLPLGTRSARVSRAISSGKLKSNGLKGRQCRVHRSDALAWAQSE